MLQRYKPTREAKVLKSDDSKCQAGGWSGGNIHSQRFHLSTHVPKGMYSLCLQWQNTESNPSDQKRRMNRVRLYNGNAE